MRRPLECASGRRFLLVLAATFVLALAATSPAAAVAATTGGGEGRGDCSMETALRVGAPYFFDPGMANPIGQVLCGAFTGPGSQAMAVTFNAPTCWPHQGWAVFQLVDDDWELALIQRLVFLVPPLTAVGDDIREVRPVHRLGDPRCLPEGGTRARTWHWDGTRFVASAWEQVTPGEPLRLAVFTSPKRTGVICVMWDDPSIEARYAHRVHCQSHRRKPYLGQKALVRGNGTVSLCRVRNVSGSRHCRLACGCFETPPPVLRYGTEVVVGRFRCRSVRSGMRCVILRSGKGFALNKDRSWRIGPR